MLMTLRIIQGVMSGMCMNVWCAIRTYTAHATELGNPIPQEPVFFLKASSCVVPPMALDTFDGEVHHEVELVVRLDDDLKPSEMTVGLDLTKRDTQEYLKSKSLPWAEAKSFYASAMIGDWVPYDSRAEIDLTVNENLVQKGTTDMMTWSPTELVEMLSSWAPVVPGDILFTGTPSGVGQLNPTDVIKATLRVNGQELTSFTTECV